MLISIAMYGMLRLDFGKITHMIEVTPQFLRVDDCILKEIAWQDIADLKPESHFSNGIKRSALLIIYLKTNHTYDLPVPGRILSRQRTDGGIVATNLYNLPEITRKSSNASVRREIAVSLFCGIALNIEQHLAHFKPRAGRQNAWSGRLSQS